MDRKLVQYSRFISMVLRHRPGRIGLKLDEAGWADVDALLEGMRAHGFSIDRALLERVVAENDKQRFAFSPDGTRIRANQGHTIPVNLGLAPVKPPELLYHGTGVSSVGSILQIGLHRGRRHAVHLSPDAETAMRVGTRHGKPAILVIEAGKMAGDGHSFFCSENGVWLTAHVPPQFIALMPGQEQVEQQMQKKNPFTVSNEKELLAYLDSHGITYHRSEHPPVYNCEEAALYRSNLTGLETKNLFLRDVKGRFYLLMTSCAKRIDFDGLGALLDTERVRFAPADQLMSTLGLTPGSVTVLALVNDPQKQVTLLVDSEYWPSPAYLCHPLVNTSTLVLDHETLLRFLAVTGHAPQIIDIPREGTNRP